MKLVKWQNIQPEIYSIENKKNVYFLFFVGKNNNEEKIMRKIIEGIENQLTDVLDKKIFFYKINAIDEGFYQDFNFEFNILKTPSYIILHDKKVIFEGMGIYPSRIFFNVITGVLE